MTPEEVQALAFQSDSVVEDISRSAHKRQPQVLQKFRLFKRPDVAVIV